MGITKQTQIEESEQEQALEQLAELYKTYQNSNEFSDWEENFIVDLTAKKDRFGLTPAQRNKIGDLWEKHCS